MDTIKRWAVPLLRTFLSAALATLPTFNAANIDSANLKAVAVAALMAGVNAVVIALQRITPGIPNP